jgi:hypothetical protein
MYLETFNNWLQNMIDDFRIVYRLFYPLYFLGMVAFIGLINTGDEGGHVPLLYRIVNSDQVFKVAGIPVIWLSVILLLTAIVAYFSPRLYMIDIRLVYGRLMDRMENMIKEMEELRA